jgi:amino-acid N-acetyltransferase
VSAVRSGVKRAHLVDARVDGGLLLELYSRDGVGTMVSADFYEGIRVAEPRDADGVAGLLAPLQADGVVRARSRAELEEALAGGQFFVAERDGTLLGCAQLVDVGASPDGEPCGELAAFCVAPAARGSGRGDSLLDYVEQAARERGVRRLLLLTTRTADWFEQRDFAAAGPAAAAGLLPRARRAAVDASRGAKLYVKPIVALDGRAAAPAGKRIGF